MTALRTLSLLCLSVVLGACSQIDTGNVGVERTLGKVGQEALPPGLYFTLFKTVDEFTAKEVSFSLENLTPKSRDNLTMQDVDIDIYFKTTPASIPALSPLALASVHALPAAASASWSFCGIAI